MPRKESKSTPKLEGSVLYDLDEAIDISSKRWHQWLQDHTSFYYQNVLGSFTARRERRRNGDYWYAYRRHQGKLYKSYLGRAEELTREHLRDIALALGEKAGA